MPLRQYIIAEPVSSESEAVTAVGNDIPAPLYEADALPRGTTLGRYVVLSHLGAGGMGVVYACYDPNLDRKVAVKLLYAGDPSQSSQGRARLMQEAQALARVSDPNVVAVHDVDEARGHVYLAMEFVEGQTLGSWARAQRRAWREVLDVYVQAARGLSAVHRAGLLHRDFKPDNAMLGHDGRVRVMDFGLAVEHDQTLDPNTPAREEVAQLAATGRVAGTPAYMAPEQHLALQSDARADQFSWCVALYEALVGERPFRGDSIAQLAIAVSEGQRSDAGDIDAVPRWLRRVLDRGLAVEPAQRFASMEELLRVIDQGLARQRRSRWLGVGGVVATVFAAKVGWQHLDQRSASRACAEAATEIDSIWNEHARADLTQAMLDSGTTYGRDAVERATPWIDRQVEAWRSAREQTCRRFRVEGTLALDVYAQASACLDERRAELEALLESMTEADAAAAFQLVRSAADLTPAQRCAEESELARDKVPADEHRAAVAEIRQLLARAQALRRMSRLETALALVDDASERARSTGWVPVVIQCDLARAMVLEELGKYADVEPILLETFERAWAAGLDESAMQAAQSLASLYARPLRRPDDAFRWGRLAAITYERLPDRHGPHGIRVLAATMAVVHMAREDVAAARGEMEAALSASEEVYGSQHPEVANVLSNLGVILQADDDFEGARKALQRALEIFEHTLGPNHPDVALTVTNLGGIAQRTGDDEQAIASWERAIAIHEHARGPDHPAIALVLGNLAIVHRGRGEVEKALPYAERAMAIYEAAVGREHPDTAAAMVRLARLRAQADPAAAIDQLDLALGIQERTLRPDHRDLASTLEARARVLSRLGEHAAARDDLRRFVSILEATPEHPSLAGGLQWLAELELEAGDAVAACHTLERLEPIACATDASSEACTRARESLGACTHER